MKTTKKIMEVVSSIGLFGSLLAFFILAFIKGIYPEFTLCGVTIVKMTDYCFVCLISSAILGLVFLLTLKNPIK